MTDAILHKRPSMRDVVREQIRTVGLSLRWPAIAGLLLIPLVALLMIVNGAEVNSFHPERWLIPGVVGALLPIAVWRSDDLFGTGFMWTLPVDRRRHAIAKVFAGWVWLMAGIAFVFIGVLAITLIADATILAPETVWYMPDFSFQAQGTLHLSDLPSQQMIQRPLLWLGPFTGATVMYLFATSLALGAKYPLRWIVGTFIGLFVIFGVISEIGLSSDDTRLALLPSGWMHTFALGRYGLDAVLAARTEGLRMDVKLADGSIVPVWRNLPDVTDWAKATLLWLTIAFVALWAAVSRHREHRRG